MRLPRCMAAVLLCISSASLVCPAYAQSFEAGVDFKALPSKVQTASAPRVEVVEFFMYPCEHCFAFEPFLAAWEKDKPDNVALRRIPIAAGEIGTRYARVFYTAQALGVWTGMHNIVFNRIHQHQQFFTNDDQVRDFFVAQGVEAAAFDRTYQSLEIDKQITQGRLLAQLYGVTTVPSLGVDGRYWVNAQHAKTYPRFLEICDYLIAKSP